MDVAEAELLVKRLVAELVERQYTAERAAKEAAALRKIVAGYVEMFPVLESVVSEDANLFLLDGDADGTPKGVEAVRLIMQEQPNYWFWVSEVVEALKARGWLPESDNPANAVRTALQRLVSTPDSDIYKSRGSENKVVYSYRPDDDPTASNEPPAYDEEPF